MELIEKINNKSAKVGVIGLGYVGLPLALEFTLKGFKVTGFDIDEKKTYYLRAGKSYIKHIDEEKIKAALKTDRFTATADFTLLPEMDAIIICVPTPLNEHREPDMSYIVNTANIAADYLREGQLIVLESTTYPGTTVEVLQPLFETAPSRSRNKKIPVPYDDEETDVFSGNEHEKFTVGKDFFLAFSPEREDPNNAEYSTSTIPKVVGGATPKCRDLAVALYNNVVVKTVPVSSTQVAEATKLLENIYRSVNIALVNELKMVFDKMDINIWEVIEAAKTKPFGFSAFYPGPGLGGHCIPIDPFYLTWKAREYDTTTKFIELAGEINTYQPYYVVEKAMEVLNKHKKSINGASVLILGAAYKKDIDDMRESPSLKLIEIFSLRGASVAYNDPYVLKLPKTRKYDYDMESVVLTAEVLKSYDLIVLSTDHTSYNYRFIAENAAIILDTRNAFGKNGVIAENIYKA